MSADDRACADEEEREFWDGVFMYQHTSKDIDVADAADAADLALRRRRASLGVAPASPPPFPGDEWKDS